MCRARAAHRQFGALLFGPRKPHRLRRIIIPTEPVQNASGATEREAGASAFDALSDLAAGGADADQVAEAIVVLWREIDLALHPVIGRRGVAAMFSRCLNLNAAAYPWLSSAHQGALEAVDPSALKAVLAQRPPAQALAGGTAVLQSFRDLLVSLVGAPLADRLVRPVRARSGIAPAGDSRS
jgi:hypothetical protein